MQLTGSDTRLTDSYCFNKIDDPDVTTPQLTEPCIVLIPGLSAVPQEQADPGNGYFLGLFLREDLPGRFFMTLIP
jgi:hypothetical protein